MTFLAYPISWHQVYTSTTVYIYITLKDVSNTHYYSKCPDQHPSLSQLIYFVQSCVITKNDIDWVNKMEDSPGERVKIEYLTQWFSWPMAMKLLALLRVLGSEVFFPLVLTSYQWLVSTNSRLNKQSSVSQMTKIHKINMVSIELVIRPICDKVVT